MYQIWCQSVEPFDSFSRFLNVWHPKTPKCPPPPCVSMGTSIGVYPFPDESAHVCHIWCQSVQPFDSFNILLNLWPPKTPQNAPWDIEGPIVFSYVHSQTNPQTCTKFGANRLSRLTASPDFLMFDPLKLPSAPPTLCLDGHFDWRISIPRRIRRPVPNWVPLGPAVWQLPQTFEFVTP